MKYTGEIPFEIPSFPVKIMPCRSSEQSLSDERSQAIHEAVEIKLFYEGASTLIIDGRTVRAAAGDTVIINPYEFHTTVHSADENGKYHLVLVGLDLFEGLAAADIDLKELFLAKQIKLSNLFEGDAVLEALLSEAVAEWQSKEDGYRLGILGNLARVFAYLLRRGVASEREKPGAAVIRYYKVIEPALRKIRDEYQSSFTVDDLAELCYTSKYHFCRIFKLSTGATPIQYLNKYRLKIAHEMLKDGNMRIGDVARDCGFDSVSYFSKIYKKFFGYSPKGNKE